MKRLEIVFFCWNYIGLMEILKTNGSNKNIKKEAVLNGIV